MKNRGKIFDTLLEMHGIGVMAAGAGTAATPVDLGLGAPKRGGIPEPVGYTEGKLILDITACSTQTTLNSFEIRLQASHDATFTTFVTLFSIPLGTVATHHSGSVFISQPLSNLAAGFPAPAQVPVRIAQPFCNDLGGVVYRWLRLYTAIGATVTTGINYYAYLSI